MDARICDMLRQGPHNIDELAEKLRQPIQQIASALLQLELKKLIRRSPGNVYEITPAKGPGHATPSQLSAAQPEKMPATSSAAQQNPTLAPAVVFGQRYVDNGDNTMTDTKHRLMWIRNPGLLNDPLGEFTVPCEVNWAAAKRACGELRFLGFTDWRLPSVPEYQALCDDMSQFDPTTFLQHCDNRTFWTDSESKRCPGAHYDVCLSYGYTGEVRHGLNVMRRELQVSGPWDSEGRRCVRPVRSGM